MKFHDWIFSVLLVFCVLLTFGPPDWFGHSKDHEKAREDTEKIINSIVEKKVREKVEQIRGEATKGGIPTEEGNLPSSFSCFRLVVQVEPKDAMTEEAILDNVQKLCDAITTAPTVKDIRVLAVAGACEEEGKIVFRVLKSNEEPRE